MSMTISKEIRHQVRERAKYLCEYCHSSEEASIVGWVSASVTQQNRIRCWVSRCSNPTYSRRCVSQSGVWILEKTGIGKRFRILSKTSYFLSGTYCEPPEAMGILRLKRPHSHDPPRSHSLFSNAPAVVSPRHRD